MSDSIDSVLDTSVIIHAQTNDHFSAECRRFLAAVELGTIRTHLEPIVLHELGYVLPRYRQHVSRADVALFLRAMLGWPGIQGDVGLMDDAVRRWAAHPKLSFVDAYLAALAARHGCPVYTKNVRDFAGQGVTVPDPLPDGAVASG